MDTPMSLLKYLPFHSFIPSCPPPSFNPRFSSLSSISGSISVTRPRCFPSVSPARHPWPKHAASPVTALQWEGDVEVSSVDVGDEGTEDFEEAPLPVELYETEAAIAVKDYRESLAQRLKSDDEELETGKKKRKKKTRDEHLVPQQVPDRLLPKVAIIGRPNVGKSALFNRIAGRDVAIVNDEPGVTRDRLYARAFWGLHEFMLVDTGGVLTVPKSDTLSIDGIAITGGGGQNAIAQAVQEATAAGLPSMIERQAAAALENSSVILFVVDGQAGVSSADIDIADWLRKKHSDKKIILAVNKCESPTKGLLQAAEFWSLGFDPVAVSAISGRGTGDLLDYVCSGLKLPQAAENEDENEDRIPAIAIVGRPNVGKSSILNALVGEERTIVSPVSGTTRDAIDTEITTPEGQIYRLIDTAGIRRRAAIASAGSKTESLSVNRAFRAIRRSDVVALVIDAMDCVTEQDYRLGERIESEGKGCVIVINKWDTIPEKDSKTSFYYEQDVRENLRVLDWAPIVFTSAVNSPSVYRILQKAISVEKERSRRLSTAILNQVVQEAMALQQPPRSKGGKKGRIYYCTQAAIRPPTFVFFVNDAKLFSEVYRRYMEKQLRSNVGYPGTPIRLLWRSKRKPEREKGSTVAAATVIGPS